MSEIPKWMRRMRENQIYTEGRLDAFRNAYSSRWNSRPCDLRYPLARVLSRSDTFEISTPLPRLPTPDFKSTRPRKTTHPNFNNHPQSFKHHPSSLPLQATWCSCLVLSKDKVSALSSREAICRGWRGIDRRRWVSSSRTRRSSRQVSPLGG